MKKLLCLLFVLCAVLFSCTDTDEVITPNEIPTPNEPEIFEPDVIESEEQKLPFISEQNIKFGDNEQTLPAEDENTIEIVIPYPEDFTFGYTEPEIVAPEDFDWGKYVPFVRYSVGSYGGAGGPVYTYAFLGKDINDIGEGHSLYQKLDSKYKKFFEYSVDDTIDGYPLKNQQDAIPLISESRIIWVSTDASEVGNFYIEKVDSYISEYSNWEITVWDGIYELYKNEELVSETTVKADYYNYREGDYGFNFDDGGFLHYFTGAYTSPMNSRYMQYGKYNAVSEINRIHNNTNTLIFQHSDMKLIYDLDEMKLKYKIKFDFDTAPIEKNYSIDQIIDGRYLVITFYSDMIIEGACHNIYLYDLEERKMERINGYSFNPLVSPDRKYLIYSRETWRNTEVNSRINNEYDLKNGFYIKNLESGKTTFYEYNAEYYNAEYSSSTQSINWVNEENLKALIG